jgi:thiaminase
LGKITGGNISFSKTAWSAIEFTYKPILEHPFYNELAEGTLETEKF